jgi:flavin reductase (DIM6/NTAB) family NADH-FMN oxidoreductase RutF
MVISSENFRDALRHFPSGVAIVTIKASDQVHGLTVSALASVSPEPPLIAVIIDHQHHAYRLLEEDGASFAVNLLHQDQVGLSNRFAWVKDQDRFTKGNWGVAKTGAPILINSLAWMDCTIHSRHHSENHTIYIGLVQASGVPRPDENPLIYWNRGYRQIMNFQKHSKEKNIN